VPWLSGGGSTPKHGVQERLLGAEEGGEEGGEENEEGFRAGVVRRSIDHGFQRGRWLDVLKTEEDTNNGCDSSVKVLIMPSNILIQIEPLPSSGIRFQFMFHVFRVSISMSMNLCVCVCAKSV
jgi:hypothetical protein